MEILLGTVVILSKRALEEKKEVEARGRGMREGEHARPSRALLLFDRPRGSKLDREKRRVKRLQAHSLY